MGLLLIIGSYRADIVNALVFLGLSSIPMAIATYVLTYKPYRQFIFGLVKKVSSVAEFVCHESENVTREQGCADNEIWSG